jgi:hypothetical protein
MILAALHARNSLDILASTIDHDVLVGTHIE